MPVRTPHTVDKKGEGWICQGWQCRTAWPSWRHPPPRTAAFAGAVKVCRAESGRSAMGSGRTNRENHEGLRTNAGARFPRALRIVDRLGGEAWVRGSVRRGSSREVRSERRLLRRNHDYLGAGSQPFPAGGLAAALWLISATPPQLPALGAVLCADVPSCETDQPRRRLPGGTVLGHAAVEFYPVLASRW